MTRKLLLISLILTFFYYSGRTQTSWTVVEDGSDVTYASEIGFLSNNLVILGTDFIYTCGCGGKMHAYLPNGDTAWTNNLDGYFLEMKILNDSIFISYNDNCGDVLMPSIKLKIINSSGETLVDSTYFDPSHYFSPMDFILPTNGTSIFFLSKKKDYSSNLYQSALIQKSGGLGKVSSINFNAPPTATELISDRSFAVFTDSLVYIVNDSLELIDSVSLGAKILSEAKKDNLFYCLVNNNIVVLDSALSPIKNISLSQNYPFQQIRNSSGELILSALVDSSLQFSFLKSDTLNKVFKIDSSYQAKDFLWSSGKLFTTGNTVFGHGFFACHDTLLKESKTLSDIELLEIQVKNIKGSYMGPTGTEYFSHYCADYDVLVKNRGSDTIHNFNVFADLESFGICGSDDYDRIQVELLPGEQKWVTGNRLCEGSKKVEFCMEVVAPNSSYEKNTSNNKICGYYGDVGIEKIRANNIQIYPNPFRETLNVSQEQLDFTYYQILDSRGKLIKMGNLFDLVHVIELADLTNGFYYLNLQSHNKMEFYKLQKL